MTDTNAPVATIDLTALLDQLAAVKPNLCIRTDSMLEGNQSFWLDNELCGYELENAAKPDRADLIEVCIIFKRMFRLHQLPLTIEHPIQWDIVSVRSGKFQALYSEEAIALLFVLIACLEAMEGRSAFSSAVLNCSIALTNTPACSTCCPAMCSRAKRGVTTLSGWIATSTIAI
jgi:hypothetical protein